MNRLNSRLPGRNAARERKSIIKHAGVVVCLVASRKETKWYRDAIAAARTRTDLGQRVRFISPDGLPKARPPFASTIIVFSPEPLSDEVLRQLDELGHAERLDATRELVEARMQATT